MVCDAPAVTARGLGLGRASGDPIDTREMFTEWAQGKGGELYPEDTGKLVQIRASRNQDSN